MTFDERVAIHCVVTHPAKQEEKVEDKAAGFQCNQNVGIAPPGLSII